MGQPPECLVGVTPRVLPARLPLPYELGLRRLREEFGLRPVEYPTTRAPQASPAERAADIHAAFADPEIKAVIASIGGDDQLMGAAAGVVAGGAARCFGKARYTREQHDAVVAAVAEYSPGVPLVFGVDFGHTEPQFVIPSGGTVTVDGASREIYVTY
jgi:muramoyltetrapeptide carboxypeptidase LdcA involved in peptidoglycan recycling